MRIYLVGFMGAGKSTVGRLLAKRLGLPLMDLDSQAAKRRGRPVSEILTDEGEASFRELESALLAETAELADVVVATGGGVLNRVSNRRFIQCHGVSVWLHPSFDDLLTRLLQTSPSLRPLFGGASQARALYRRRRSQYQQADLEVVVDAGERPEQTAARVMSRLEENRCAT